MVYRVDREQWAELRDAARTVNSTMRENLAITDEHIVLSLAMIAESHRLLHEVDRVLAQNRILH